MRLLAECFQALGGVPKVVLADRMGCLKSGVVADVVFPTPDYRRTVRQALANAVPPERKAPARVAPKLEPARALIDAMLTGDLTAPRKQRHTARRDLARLVDEHELTDLTYSAVRDTSPNAGRRSGAAAGKAVEDAFVPQTHEPGAEGEVDFADLWIDLAGVRAKVFLFTMRLSFSGKAVHRAYATQGQRPP